MGNAKRTALSWTTWVTPVTTDSCCQMLKIKKYYSTVQMFKASVKKYSKVAMFSKQFILVRNAFHFFIRTVYDCIMLKEQRSLFQMIS